MVDLHEHVYTETAWLGQQDTTVVVAVSGSAMLVLVLAACVCWRRNSSGLLSGREDSRRDTVPLDDLLSKPSLADPESVFSEAGSNDFRPIPRAGSRFVASGDENSFWHESGSVSGASHGDLDASSSHLLVGLNNDPDPNTGLLPRTGNYQGKQLSKTNKSAQQLELEQLQLQNRQNVDNEATCRLDVSHRFKSTAESGYLGDKSVHDVRASVHTTSGSPKTGSHRDISEKVGLNPASLKIHRDSVTGDSAPFLSSARCSFSHEVGHIVHGNQTPRPSLPRTEEVENGRDDSSPEPKNVDECSCEATGRSVEGKATGLSVEGKATELSVNVHSGQFEELAPTNLTFNSQGQVRGQGLLVNESTDSNHRVSLGYPRVTIQDSQQPGREVIGSTTADGDEHPDIPREISPSKSHVRNDINTGRPASDLDQCQLADVTMRRCLSCVQDEAVCPDPPTKPRRQTFSLNLKIDVHFDNERESCENLPTVVCSPLMEYTRSGNHAATDTCQRYATSVSINDKNNHNNINNSSSQGGCHVDTDAKERQLEKSFAQKSHPTNRHTFVGAGKQCLQLTLAELNQVKTCNTAQPNRRFSAAESLTTAAARAAVSRANGIEADAQAIREITVTPKTVEETATADSDSQIFKTQCELPEAVSPEAESNTKTDQADVRSEADRKDHGRGPSVDKVVPLSVAEGDRLLLAAGRGGRAGNIVVGINNSAVGQHEHSCDVTHAPRETEPVGLNGKSLGEVKVAEEILSQKKRPTASRIKDNNGGLVGATHNHTGENSCHHSAIVNTTETTTSITNTSHHHPEDADRTEAVVSSQRVDDSGHSEADGCKPESIVATTLSNPGCEDSINAKTHADINHTGESTDTKTHSHSNLTGESTDTKTHPSSNPTGESTERKTHPDSNLTGESTGTKTHWADSLTEETVDADRTGSVDTAGEGPVKQTAAVDTPGEGPVKQTAAVDTPGEGPVKQTAAVDGATRRPDIHRRALTVKAGHVRTMSQTNETGDAQLQRSSSVKMTSVGERARPSLGSSDKRQDRRQAVFFHDMKDVPTECQPGGGSQQETPGKQSEYAAPAVTARQQGRDTGSKVDTTKLNKKDQMTTSEVTRTHSNPGQQGPETSMTGRTHMMKQRLTGGALRGYANIPSHKQEQERAVELVCVSPQDQVTVPRTSTKAPKPAPRRLPVDKDKRVSPIRETDMSATSGITINIEDCSGSMETADASDDSDYDNPWDSLDDAVKRASIRYNRRPSRIAAGDTKTLLLKSAEDLGRLLEEADKRRHFRQTRNSCQVVSPETDSFTIPFTRFSPYRHTVKDTASQSQMSSAHSTETLLKTETPSYPQLSLLRSGDAVAADHRVLDARRPMSLTSKVRAQITSPETRQRKK